MTICPHCGFTNIEGVDTCDECGHSLSNVEDQVPATEVERALLRDHVAVLNPNPCITVAPETPIRDVLRLLVERRIGCVVVAEDGKIKGIFSERDALMKLNVQAKEFADEPVSRFMTAAPLTLPPQAKVAFAVHKMNMGSYRHVPVVQDDSIVSGIISARDILGYLTDKMRIATSSGGATSDGATSDGAS